MVDFGDPVVVVTPPLALGPVVAPILVTEIAAAGDAVDVDRTLEVVLAAGAVVVAGFAATPAVDDDAAPFCNADIKLPF